MRHASSVDRMESRCPFCEMPQDRLISENELAYAVRDAFPVTVLHTLVIPKRHVRGYFELDDAEHEDCRRLLHEEKAAIEREDGDVEGFNVGVNDGLTTLPIRRTPHCRDWQGREGIGLGGNFRNVGT